MSRERARQFEAETAIPIETAAGATVHIQRVDDSDNKEVRLYCYSEQREEKEQGINRRFCERFEAGLKNIADGLSKPRSEKRLDKLHERIGRLKEKSKGIGQHYAIELLPDASGKKAVELRWTKQPQAGTRLTHPGVYCLRSNQFVQIIRKHLQEHDIQGRWSSLREILSVQQRVTASFQRADGGALHISKATRPETELAAIYQALNLDPLPGGVQKTYV